MREHPPQALAAAEHWPDRAQRLADRFDPYAVSPHQADKPQRGGQLLGIVQLRGLAEFHRLAGVDQREKMQVLLLQVHLEKQPVEPRVRVPIDEPQVVAGHVAAKIGELDALPLALAAPLAFHPPAKDAPRDQLQLFQLGQ